MELPWLRASVRFDTSTNSATALEEEHLVTRGSLACLPDQSKIGSLMTLCREA